MNCRQLLAYLSDYLDRDLSEELAAEVRQHAATCRDCHIVLDTMNQTIVLCREAGKRGIPIVAMFDTTGALVGRWGPRPAEAQVVFEAARQGKLEKPDILERLHLWYGRDRGKALDAEFRALLQRRISGA